MTDSRGRSATKSTTFSVYSYGNPYFSSIESYRCNSAGTQDDVSGTYARLKVTFGVSALNGSNKATCTVKLAQVGGSYSTSAALTSDTAIILGGGNLAIDAVYRNRQQQLHHRLCAVQFDHLEHGHLQRRLSGSLSGDEQQQQPRRRDDF